MSAAYIVAATRTPTGRFRGTLGGVRADHLGACVLNSVLERAGLTPDAVDDVIFGCVTQIGEQSANIARTALLTAGWPQTIPGLTIDRKCGSAESAVHIAAGLIAAGACDVVVAGGAESMSRVPMGSNRDLHGEAYSDKLMGMYDLVGQGEAAERVADKWELTREELDAFGQQSQLRAAAAAAEGRFDAEITAVPVADWKEPSAELPENETFSADETIRPGTKLEKLATLKTPFREGGKVTAGNSSQISDGAAALVIVSEAALKKYGLTPRAKIRAMTTVGADPAMVLTGPVPATTNVLAKAGLTAADIDLFEVNEAFASVPLMWIKEHGVSQDKLNVNGGAIALGHPLGASGARVMTTLLHELERRDGKYGLQTFCCNGGMATATIIERV